MNKILLSGLIFTNVMWAIAYKHIKEQSNFWFKKYIEHNNVWHRKLLTINNSWTSFYKQLVNGVDVNMEMPFEDFVEKFLNENSGGIIN